MLANDLFFTKNNSLGMEHKAAEFFSSYHWIFLKKAIL